MKYDPIMCMMVDDSVKTEDRDPYSYEEIKKDIQMMKSGKASYITKNGLIGRISHSYNNRTPQSGGITKEQKTELMNLVMSANDSASALDKAIKTCDAEGEKWITMSGSHVKIDGEGNAVAGNAKVKNIINNGKAGSSKESSGSAREKLSKMSRSDLNHFAEMYGDYDDAESFRKEDIIEDMIEEHGEEKVGKMLETYNGIFKRR